MRVAINTEFKNKWTPEQLKVSGNTFRNVDISTNELIEHIKRGFAFCSQHEGWRKSENFTESNIFAVDIDHGLTIDEVTAHPFVTNYCCFIYTTASHTKENHRFRLVFQSERSIFDKKEMTQIMNGLLLKFGGDESCKDACRIFYGSSDASIIKIGKTLPLHILEDLKLISDGIKRKTYKNDAKGGTNTKRSLKSIDINTEVIDENGISYTMSEVPVKTRIHCPIHIDNKPSAFVLQSKSGTKGLWCSKCQTTYFVSSNLPHYEFDYFWKKVIIPGDGNNTLSEYSSDLVLPNEEFPIIRLNQKYLPFLDSSSPILMVKSPKGSGKTHILERLVKQAKQENKNVLLIGHRRSLIASMSKRLKLTSYFQPPVIDQRWNTVHDAKMVPPTKHYAICVDSLFNLMDTESDRYDVVIIDEVEQVFSHLTSDTLNKNNKRNNTYQVFRHYLRSCNKLVVLDADLSYLTVNTLYRMLTSEQKLDVSVIINEYRETSRKIEIYKTNNHLIGDISNSLKKGERLFICSNSKSKVNDLVSGLTKEFPDKKVIGITSDNSQKTEIQELIRDINEEILNYDAIVVSPSIGTGVDITFKNDEQLVDTVYGIFEAQINTHFDIDQQISRVRNPKHVRVWISPKVFRFETDPNAISREIIESEKSNRRVIGIDRNGRKIYDDYDNDYLQLYVDVVSAFRGSINHLKENFIKMKKKFGWTVIEKDRDKDLESAGILTVKSSKEEKERLLVEVLYSAPLISRSDYIGMKKTSDKLPFLDVHINAMMRYGIESFYLTNITPDLIQFDDNGKGRQQIRYIENLLNSDLKTRTDDFISEIQNQHTLDESQDRHITEFFYEILSRVGLLDDKDRIISDKQFSSTDLSPAIEYIKKHDVSLQRWFKLALRSDIDSKPVQQFGVFLKMLGIKTQSTSRKTPSGGKEYFYSIPSDYLNTVYEIIDRRMDKDFRDQWHKDRNSVTENRLLKGGYNSVREELKAQIADPSSIDDDQFWGVYLENGRNANL